MKIIDFYATKGFFKPNEEISFKVVAGINEKLFDCKIDIIDITDKVAGYDFKKIGVNEDGEPTLTIKNHSLETGGYFAKLSIDGKEVSQTAFDIQKRWEDFPRYGYVSKFAPEQNDTAKQIEKMTKYHVNGVQFYDWQFRHDDLLSDTNIYLDPFNRAMSLDTVNSYISECHKRNISAMPYLAVYAASVEFWEKHKEWGMYDETGKALMFEDFLGLVNPRYNSPWFKHLDNECDDVIEHLDFDGLHIDQYGEPKKAYDFDGEEIDIPKAFVDFINHQKDKDKGTVVFNAVGNWPIEQLAKSKADFMYIEVWEYTPTFKDLCDICVNAREMSGQKPLVIPIYIKKDCFHNVLIADAIINSSGGTHLEIGDGERLLSDPYFPKAEDIEEDKLAVLRKYWDFVVGYQKVLGPNALYENIDVATDKEVMTIARQNGKYTAVNFINCIKSAAWFEKLEEPEELTDVNVIIKANMNVKSIYFASPDNTSMDFKPIDFNTADGSIIVKLPSLKYWSTILIEEE